MPKLTRSWFLWRLRRGRLVRHYFFISVLLIGGGLITSGLLEVYFRYQETRENLALLQQEITAGAAFKIESFIQGIEKTMKEATRSREIAPKGLTPEYRFELEKLLLIEPSITDAVALGEDGIIRVQVSRLRALFPDEKKDLSKTAAFQQARQGKSYFGSVYFVRGSEPYMTIAVPIERFAGDVIGVLQAEVNLKYIGDVISSITVGKRGYAYLVTRSGDLVAHPDISLVLQRRNLGQLRQVSTAFHTAQDGPKLGSVEARNLQRIRVFSSYTLIPTLDWAVFIERPLKEAYEPLYASILRTSTLLLIGLGMALLASLFVARRVVRPLQKLHEGVERIGSGDLSFRLDLQTGDEIESLAEEFNKMTSQLRESYATLEQKVEERTRELTEALEEVRGLSEVSRTISSSLDLRQVLDAVATHAVNLSNSDGCGIFEFNSARRAFDIVASHNLDGAYLAAVKQTTIDLSKTTIGQSADAGAPMQIPDMIAAYDHPFRGITLKAGFRALLTVPMSADDVTRGIVLFRGPSGPFDDRVVSLLTALANQSKVAIQNARLFHEIDQKSQQLEAANKHKSQFFANVSHELRTPLNSIIGFTRLVLRKVEGQIPELQKQNLQKVLISSEHLLNLINGLLDLAKIEAGRMEVYAETFTLEDIIRVATSTVEPMLKDGRVRLVSEIAADMPPLKTDRDKLKQVLLNLLSNAIKFTEKGEIKLSAWHEDGTLKLAVSDTGIGMKKEALDYIFDEFRQADMSSTRRYGGTGLGLAIVKRFVNLMGGDITVESEPGKGSKFTITIPISLKGYDLKE
jgi:signal transduction histidine kinase